MSEKVLDLKTCFYTDNGVLKVLDGVSVEMCREEAPGVIREGGCRKSVKA